MMKKIACFALFCLLMTIVAFSDERPPLYRVLRDGKWGAISPDGTVVITPEYDYLFRFVNGMTVARMGEYNGGKRAYISSEGKPITGFDFDRAYHFFGILAVVSKDGKEGYVDREGRLVTDISFDYAEDFRGDYALVRTGRWSTAKWGAIDSNGTVTIPLEYEELSHTADSGTMVFRAKSKYGLIDGNGRIVAPATYDNLYSSGRYLIATQKTGNLARSLFLGVDGSVLYQLEGATQIRSASGNLIVVFSAGKYSLVDARSRSIVAADFDYLWVSSERFAITGTGSGRDRRYGVVDDSGRQIAPPVFEWISQFDEQGLAIVSRDSRYGCINEYGEHVVEPVYEEIRRFSEGYAAVRKNGKWGYIDSTGREVIDCEFDWVYDFSEGLAVFRVGDRQNGKRGYIDMDGDVVIKPQFDWAYSFENGIAHVAFGGFFDGTFGYIDTTGLYVWEPSN